MTTKMKKEVYNKIKEKVNKLELLVNGGKGSGNFGHAGRPGEIGGSGKGGPIPRNLDEAKKMEKAAEKAFSDYVESHSGPDYDQKIADKLGAEFDRLKDWRQTMQQRETYKKTEDEKSGKVESPSLKGKSLYEKVHMIQPGDEVHIKPQDNLPNFDRKIKVDYIQDGTIHYGSSETSDGYTYPAWAIKDITKIVRKKKNSIYAEVSKRLDEIEKMINGGKGSGNYGHQGRPGEVGGSGKGFSAGEKVEVAGIFGSSDEAKIVRKLKDSEKPFFSEKEEDYYEVSRTSHGSEVKEIVKGSDIKKKGANEKSKKQDKIAKFEKALTDYANGDDIFGILQSRDGWAKFEKWAKKERYSKKEWEELMKSKEYDKYMRDVADM